MNFGGLEARTWSITLHGDDPVMVAILMEFCCFGKYRGGMYEYDPQETTSMWRSWTHRHNPKRRPVIIIESSVYLRLLPIVVPKPNFAYAQDPNPDFKGLRRVKLEDSQTPRHIFLHLQVWEIADKYRVLELLDQAGQHFKTAAKHYACTQEFFDAVQYIFKDMPEHAMELRWSAVHAIGMYGSRLILLFGDMKRYDEIFALHKAQQRIAGYSSEEDDEHQGPFLSERIEKLRCREFCL